MIQARIRDGQVELVDPTPQEWEGQFVKIIPLSPDDLLSDLEERLAILESLGPMEFEPGERDVIDKELEALNAVSREAMAKLMGP